MPSLEAPRIDPRTYDDVVAQVEDLARRHSGWQPTGMDAGGALVRVFANMAGQVIERVNRLPERNFLAFLDLIGTRPEPAQPARTPLTFQLAAGTQVDTLVPAGTQVATLQEGDAEPVVFTTERDLVVTRSRLVAAFAREPETDRSSDLTALVDGRSAVPFAPFRGAEPAAHFLYLGHSALATPETKDITLRPDTSDFSPWVTSVAWDAWDGTAWRPVPSEAYAVNQGEVRYVEISLTGVPPIPPRAVNGVVSSWLRARLTVPPSRDGITVANVDVTLFINRRDAAAQEIPEAGLANDQPLDLSRDFRPFGDRPATGDVFYMASDQAFSKPDAAVEIHVGLTGVEPAQTVTPPTWIRVLLAWEFWDGSRWQILGYSGPGVTPNETAANNTYFFSDTTNGLLTPGMISFRCPSSLMPVEAGGQVRRWVRVRIARDSYGADTRYEPVTDASGNPVPGPGNVPLYRLVPSTYRPPSLRAILLGLFWSASLIAEHILAENDRAFVDRASSPDNFLKAFVAAADPRPTLYLGFDRAFANREASLYCGVSRSLYDAGSEPAEVIEEAAIAWEFWNGSGWQRLGTRDETRGFTRSGLVTFVGPAGFQCSLEFGREAFWLRARWERGQYAVEPRLERVLLNTTWAVHVEGGGGADAGNLPAGRLTQLRGTVPYVDRVAQPEPAAGGTAAESLEAVRVRGPKALRHRDRAMAASDFEDLAFQASPRVARARTLSASGAGDAGAVTLLVVSASSDPKPVPDLQLLDRVRTHLEARLAATADLRVIGPDWLRMTVEAEVVPARLEASTDVQAAVQERLRSFLHPLTGGLDGRGWAFGARPYRSDFYALIESTPGVDHVRRLTVTEAAEEGGARPGRFLVYSGDHRILLSSDLDPDTPGRSA